MEDMEIIELYWQRDERAVKESDVKYGRLCKGIALRLLSDSSAELPERWHQQRNPNLLDPSVPEVLEHIRNDIRRMADWSTFVSPERIMLSTGIVSPGRTRRTSPICISSAGIVSS